MRTNLFYKIIVLLFIVCFAFASCTDKKSSPNNNINADSDLIIQKSTKDSSSAIDSTRQYWRSYFALVEQNSLPAEYLFIADSVLQNSKILFSNDTEITALSWLSKGFAMRKLSLFDSALICYSIAQSYYKKVNLENKAINCLYQEGLVYFSMNNYERGFEIMKEGIARTMTAKNPDTTLILKFCNYISSKYANIFNYDSATSYLNKCEKYFVNPENIEIGSAYATYLNLSTTYQKTGNFDKAVAYLNKALELAQKSNNEMKIFVSAYNLALLKSEIGDYQGSNIFVSKYLNIKKATFDTASGLQKASAAYDLTDLHNLSAINFSALNEQNNSGLHFQKALEYAKIAFEPNSFSLAEKYANLGDYYANFTQEWDSVLYYENMIKTLLNETDEEYNVLVKYYYLPTCALAYANLGNEKKALQFADLAINEKKDSGYQINWENESDPLNEMQSVQKIADTYFALYEKTSKKLYAQKSLYLYDELNKGTNFLIVNNYDKNILKALNDNDIANNKKIELLWKLSKDKNALDKNVLFASFEQNKSIILKKYYKQQQITQNKVNPFFADLRRLQGLKNELTQQFLKDSSLNLTLNKEYNDLNGKIDLLVKKIDDMMLAKSEICADNINFKSLYKISDKTAIIDFVAANDAIYVLTIYKGNYSLKRIEYTKDFEAELKGFTSGLRNHNIPNKSSDNLFKQLILNEFPSNKLPENIIIIPDGELSNIPFEALVTYQNGDTVHYLGDECTIRYEYCLSFLLNENNKQNTNKELLAIAPKFEQQQTKNIETEYAGISNNLLDAEPGLRAGFGPLKYNKAEADAITKKFSGMELAGDAATEEAFRRNANKYNVLHLATHAYSNADDPNLSGIIFKVNNTIVRGSITASLKYKDSILEQDNILHAYEIQDLNLNANLVVLSACETGIGKYQTGEGTMSLARAFKYANCPNVVTSLWKVDDGATKEIMTSFYENLGKGIGKADALAEAKRMFRKNHSTASPFYWSAFILIGDNEPVHLEKKSSFFLWLSGGITLLISVIIIAAKRKSKTTS